MSGEKKTEVAMPSADYVLQTPLQVIGVQKETPICWSPDGSLLAFVLGNKTISIFRPISEGPRAGEYEAVVMLEGHSDNVKAISFHPKDSNVLVSCGYEGLWVWDVASRTTTVKLNATMREFHSSDVLCFTWACDGTSLLTGSKDSDVKVWDVQNNYALLETIVGHKASVLSIVVHPETKMIATAGRDSTIKIWDGKTLDVSFRAKRADDSGIKCALLHNLDGHRGDIVTLTWAAPFVLYSGARDNTIKVWDCRNGNAVRDFEDKANAFGKHRGDIRRMICLPGGPHIVTCSLDSTMKLWKAAPTEAKEVIELSDAKRDEAEAKLLASILSDGVAHEEAKAATESDKLLATVQLFDLEGVQEMALSPGAPILATSSSANAVKLWHVRENIAAPKLFQEFRGHLEKVNEACLMEDNTLVTVSDDYFVHVYNLDGTVQPRHISFDSSVLCAAVRPANGAQIGYIYAGGADYSIKAYRIDNLDDQAIHHDRTTPPEPHELVSAVYSGHSGRVTTLALRPDGKIMASAGFDYAILLWKLDDALKPCTQFRPASAVPRVKPITRVDAHKGHIMCLRFGPDKLLASCSNDHSVKVWKFSAGMLRTSLSLQWTADEVHDSCVSAVEWGKGAFSNILFSSSWDRSVNMFAAKPQKVDGQAQPLCPRLIAHEARITDMDVSRSGEFLVTVSVDQSALVWRIAQNSCTPLVRCTISVTNGFPSAVSAGSSTFVTASGFGQIMQWPFPTPENMHLLTPAAVAVNPTSATPLVMSMEATTAVVSVGGIGVSKAADVKTPAGAGVGVGAGAGAGAGTAAVTPSKPQDTPEEAPVVDGAAGGSA